MTDTKKEKKQRKAPEWGPEAVGRRARFDAEHTVYCDERDGAPFNSVVSIAAGTYCEVTGYEYGSVNGVAFRREADGMHRYTFSGVSSGRMTRCSGSPRIAGIDGTWEELFGRKAPGTPNKHKAGDKCPDCATGTLRIKHGKHGAFLGCSAYPNCRHAEDAPAGTPDAPAPVVTPSTPAPTPMPATLDTPADVQTQLAAAIAAVLAAAPKAGVDRAEVATIVAEEMQRRIDDMRATFVVRVNDLPETKHIGTAHAKLGEVLHLILAGFDNIYVVGPAGTGKTTLAAQAAKALVCETFPEGRPFSAISCSPGQGESSLVGRMIPKIATGEELYRCSEFVRIFENGGVFLLDEVDAADASILLVINAALSNGWMVLPDGRRVERHPLAVVIAAANTYGTGQDRLYVGRAQLDAATLDRFVGAVVDVDYDAEIEKEKCPDAAVRNAVLELRRKASAEKLRRVVSTRSMVAAHRLVAVMGKTIPEAMRALTASWSAADRQVCGIAA